MIAGRFEHALYNGAALHNSTWRALFVTIGTGTSSAHVIEQVCTLVSSQYHVSV